VDSIIYEGFGECLAGVVMRWVVIGFGSLSTSNSRAREFSVRTLRAVEVR